jgi:hypothetical protein
MAFLAIVHSVAVHVLLFEGDVPGREQEYYFIDYEVDCRP